MINPAILTQDLTLVYQESTERDAYNQPVGEPTTVSVKGYLRPLRTNTVVTGGQELMTDASIILQPGVRIDGLIQVDTGNDARYDLDGEPTFHFNPLTGEVAYVQVYLRRGRN